MPHLLPVPLKPLQRFQNTLVNFAQLFSKANQAQLGQCIVILFPFF